MTESIHTQWEELHNAWANGDDTSPSSMDMAAVVVDVTDTDATLGFVADVYEVLASSALEPKLLAEVIVEIFTRIR